MVESFGLAGLGDEGGGKGHDAEGAEGVAKRPELLAKRGELLVDGLDLGVDLGLGLAHPLWAIIAAAVTTVVAPVIVVPVKLLLVLADQGVELGVGGIDLWLESLGDRAANGCQDGNRQEPEDRAVGGEGVGKAALHLLLGRAGSIRVRLRGAAVSLVRDHHGGDELVTIGGGYLDRDLHHRILGGLRGRDLDLAGVLVDGRRPTLGDLTQLIGVAVLVAREHRDGDRLATIGGDHLRRIGGSALNNRLVRNGRIVRRTRGATAEDGKHGVGGVGGATVLRRDGNRDLDVIARLSVLRRGGGDVAVSINGYRPALDRGGNLEGVLGALRVSLVGDRLARVHALHLVLDAGGLIVGVGGDAGHRRYKGGGAILEGHLHGDDNAIARLGGLGRVGGHRAVRIDAGGPAFNAGLPGRIDLIGRALGEDGLLKDRNLGGGARLLVHLGVGGRDVHRLCPYAEDAVDRIGGLHGGGGGVALFLAIDKLPHLGGDLLAVGALGIGDHGAGCQRVIEDHLGFKRNR